MRKNMKRKINKNSRSKFLLGFWLFSVILIGLGSSVLAQDGSYHLSLSRGTMILDVMEYNEDKWDSYIGKNETPSDWFAGDSEELDSQSKITIRATDEVSYNTYDLWTLVFMGEFSEEALGVLMADPNLYNFSEDQVNSIYDQDYSAWETLYARWNFVNEEFSEEANSSNNFQWILKDPKDYGEFLENYNEWATEANMKLQMMGLSVPVYSSEDFLWMLLLKGLIIADPIENYGEDMIDGLEIEDAEMNGNVLNLKKVGKKEYTVKITFNAQGMQKNLKLEDSDGEIIYEISENKISEIILIVIPFSLLAAIIGVIILALRHKQKIHARSAISEKK